MKLIDTFPTNEIKGLQYRVGRVLPFGATLIGNSAVNFSIFSREATGCTLVLYHHGQEHPFVEIPFPESFRIGNVYSMLVFGINIDWIPMRNLSPGAASGENSKSRILLLSIADRSSVRIMTGRVINPWRSPWRI